MAKKEIKDVNKVLVENFVSLQRVMTNLSLKFDNLASQISKLLELFEISAKTIAEKNPQGNVSSGGGSMQNRELMGKIDGILEQNKVIARGLALIHEGNSPRLSEERMDNPPVGQRAQQTPVQLPRKQVRPSAMPSQMPVRRQDRTDGYQKSISNPKNEQQSK